MKTKRSISITFQQAINQANKLNDCATDLKNIQKKLQNIINTLQCEWVGDGANQYIAKCNALQTTVTRASYDLDQVSSVVRRIARSYYNAEMKAIELANLDSSK